MAYTFLTVLLIILRVAALCFIVVGNAVIIYVMCKKKNLQRQSNHYILAVCIGDLLVGALSIPTSISVVIKDGKMGFQPCLYLIAITTGIHATLTHCLVAVSVDRYWAICHPISYQNSKGSAASKWIILFCWVIGMLTGFIPVFGLNSEEGFTGHCILSNVVSFSYLFILNGFTCFGSMLTMIVLYYLIYRKIIDQSLRMSSISVVEQADNTSKQREIRVANTFVWIIGSGIICWIPLNIIFFVIGITENRNFFYENNLLSLYNIAVVAFQLNSVIDPIIYACRIKDVREAVKKFLSCGRNND